MTPLPKLGSPDKKKTHRAIQLFNFDENDQITFNAEDVLPLLQHPDIKNKKVCVISIAGALRQGKSFILNFLIRYLSSLSHKRSNKNNWLRPENGPISGFSWKSGPDRHTLGILIWSEIFLVKLPDSDEKIAVILMDTQGTFDNQTTVTQCAQIFALSVLLSSLQIYNLKENIKQDDLLHLQLFSGYGRMMSQSTNAKPFQKLLFLIRDWQWSDGKTGDDLLQTALNNLQESKKEELISLKDSITENFEKISCFLLPYPGKAVATSLDFSGNVDEIDLEFRKQIEKLVPDILAPGKIMPKILHNEPITVEKLIDLIHAYWNHFKNGEMPTLASAFTATAEAHHQMAFRDALEKYKNSMATCKSRKEADKIKEGILNHFRSQRKLGNASISKKYEDELNKELDNIFSNDYKDTVQDTEVYSKIQTGVVGSAAATTLATAALGITAQATAAEIAITCGYIAAGSLGVGIVVGGGVWGGYKLVKWALKRQKEKEARKGSEKKKVEEAVVRKEGQRGAKKDGHEDEIKGFIENQESGELIEQAYESGSSEEVAQTDKQSHEISEQYTSHSARNKGEIRVVHEVATSTVLLIGVVVCIVAIVVVEWSRPFFNVVN